MRKAIPLILLFCLILTGCTYFDSHIPEGYTVCEEHFEQGVIQDHTDYCKYVYDEDVSDRLEEYTELNSDGVNNIAAFFENTRDFMESADRLGEIDFDSACIDEGDLALILRAEGYPEDDVFACYTVYFYDRATNTLYYTHSNI